jgi:hypothetical protein
MASGSEGMIRPCPIDLIPQIVEPVTTLSLVIIVLGKTNLVFILQIRSNMFHAVSIMSPMLLYARKKNGGGTMLLMGDRTRT